MGILSSIFASKTKFISDYDFGIDAGTNQKITWKQFNHMFEMIPTKEQYGASWLKISADQMVARFEKLDANKWNILIDRGEGRKTEELSVPDSRARLVAEKFFTDNEG